MKIRIPAGIILLILPLYTSLTSFREKPHLLVGGWQATGTYPISLPAGKNLYIVQWTFSSDGIISRLLLTKARGKTRYYSLAYKVYEKQDEHPYPFLVCKSTCDTDLLLFFSILHLDKTSLRLKFEKQFSAEGAGPDTEILTFERVSGPPENME